MKKEVPKSAVQHGEGKALKSSSGPSSSRRRRTLAGPFSRRLAGGVVGASRQTPFDRRPVNIGEEGFYVFRALRGLVVQKEGVLPDVHHEDGIEARNVPHLVQRNPVVGEPPVSRILV